MGHVTHMELEVADLKLTEFSGNVCTHSIQNILLSHALKISI
jgi:hypothetical protein